MPMRIGLSPRAAMMNGAVTCAAATRPAPLSTVRRSRLESVSRAMLLPPVSPLICFVGSARRAGRIACRRRVGGACPYNGGPAVPSATKVCAEHDRGRQRRATLQKCKVDCGAEHGLHSRQVGAQTINDAPETPHKPVSG